MPRGFSPPAFDGHVHGVLDKNDQRLGSGHAECDDLAAAAKTRPLVAAMFALGQMVGEHGYLDGLRTLARRLQGRCQYLASVRGDRGAEASLAHGQVLLVGQRIGVDQPYQKQILAIGRGELAHQGDEAQAWGCGAVGCIGAQAANAPAGGPGAQNGLAFGRELPQLAQVDGKS